MSQEPTTPPNSQTEKTDIDLTVQSFIYAITANLWAIFNGPIQYKLARGIDLAMAEINSLDSALTSFYFSLNGSEPSTEQLSSIRTLVMSKAQVIEELGIIPPQ